jgi:hypothetical protein
MEDKTMKKERQIGIRVGVPAFFCLELEDVYRHTEGAHRALAFPGFVGLLVGLGLEQYRKGKALPEARQEEAPDDEERDRLNLLEIDRAVFPDMFNDFDEAMREARQGNGASLHLVRTGELVLINLNLPATAYRR